MPSFAPLARRATLLAATLAVLSSCQASEQPTAERGWVRLSAVSGNPAAAYFTVRGGLEPSSLVAVETPLAARTELHETVPMGGGVMTMRPLDAVSLPAVATVAFAPGSRHVMLFDLAPNAAQATETQLTLRFANGHAVVLDAAVVSAGAAPPYE